jgi:hypothetical protein
VLPVWYRTVDSHRKSLPLPTVVMAPLRRGDAEDAPPGTLPVRILCLRLPSLHGGTMSAIIDTAALVESVIGRLSEGYVFPDSSARAAELLRARLQQGAYELPFGPELCECISADLFEATSDKHLRLLWHESAEVSSDEAQLVAELREQIRRENHGVRRVERLPGNVGLIELTIIPEVSGGAPALAAAMQLDEHTDALILDLRPTRASGSGPRAPSRGRDAVEPPARRYV